ncbi:hypothetical protein BP6252_10665 [Coleophoma cylindrospora]|uniref:Acyltransferase MbtK/IucB-like conserved domain-containing protein n=1 Tax=Coleophoma cylindrospora TaxID=1849047 RepID=A0A3D8QU22_9HELO|nr:hypothetical protein BP6252_10665 [Coleophoma cylindrospora]
MPTSGGEATYEPWKVQPPTIIPLDLSLPLSTSPFLALLEHGVRTESPSPAQWPHTDSDTRLWWLLLQEQRFEPAQDSPPPRDYDEDHGTPSELQNVEPELKGMPLERKRHFHPFRKPTLQSDSLFLSSISNPSSSDFKPPTSPTRQIAMMLWTTLYWYFHQPEPSPYLLSEASKNTPDQGKPRGEWRLNIKREGVFRGRNLLQKLERMGLIASEDSTAGLSFDESSPEGWSEMFTSRRSFWQIPPNLFLFSLSPNSVGGYPGSPYGSRPSSPVGGSEPSRTQSPHRREQSEHGGALSPGLWSGAAGPFSSGSHLPTYFPPPPLQYTMTNGQRHPMRPKPPRQGQTFYTRFVPSTGQYLSFRTASLSPLPVPYTGPTSNGSSGGHRASQSLSVPAHLAATSLTDAPNEAVDAVDTMKMSDLQLLNKWMNSPRVAKFWGCAGPQEVQTEFLTGNLKSKNSFPVIGLWDGKPFGYFEIYWVKEDILGRHLGNDAGDFDRGVHVLVGEEQFRGKHRVMAWITSLAHAAFLSDYRTNNVVLEPRVDNERFISLLADAGFQKEREVTFPHKQSAFVKLRRENFQSPAL